MESVHIIFTVIYFPVLAWVSLTIIQQGKKIAVLQNMDSKLDTIELNIEKLNNRFDIFIKNELDTLREIARGK